MDEVIFGVLLLVVMFIGAIFILAKLPVELAEKPPVNPAEKPPVKPNRCRIRVEYLFKVISVGSSEVNKTVLIKRFAEGTFVKTYIHTLGVDFATKVVKIQDQTIKMVLFDTGGQELLGRLRPYYYRGANGAIVCYDITSKASFEALDSWLNEIYIHVGIIPLILVGIIPDDVDQREVPRVQVETYAQEKGLPFIEASIKTGVGVNEMFLTLTRMMLDAYSQLKDTPNSTV